MQSTRMAAAGKGAAKKPAHKKESTAPRKRLLMTGVRKGGDADYDFRIVGDPASQFPPLVLKMTLHELQQWLRHAQPPPSGLGDGPPHLPPAG